MHSIIKKIYGENVMMAESGVRIGSIVIHCFEFDRMVEFWQQVLQYKPRKSATSDWTVLYDPEKKGPNLSFQKRDRRRDRRNWLHLDLYTHDQKNEVERIVKLGGKRYPWRYEPHADYVVLEDPDGNLFCVVQVPEHTMDRSLG